MIGLTQKREQKGSQRKTLDRRENSAYLSLPNLPEENIMLSVICVSYGLLQYIHLNDTIAGRVDTSSGTDDSYFFWAQVFNSTSLLHHHTGFLYSLSCTPRKTQYIELELFVVSPFNIKNDI